MAAIVLLNGYGGDVVASSPLEGWLNLDQGRFVWFGRGQFTDDALTLTIPPRGGGCTTIDAVYLTAGTAGVVGLSYGVGADGTVTVTRTDTTTDGEISFLIVGRG